MTEIETDSRGRVTIPKEVRERYGERYRLVELRDSVKLVPIPDNPLGALRESASDELKEASMEEIRESADEEGRKQAEENVR
ncbi:MAG: AbrB/MazE/SpoVT family DNA-binding domain-containing protein [Halobacteriales archaeon]|nr:AbrB/MazE/SpoVT family DNA-binding domain-containing protein [Halobacteriales archaeon]